MVKVVMRRPRFSSARDMVGLIEPAQYIFADANKTSTEHVGWVVIQQQDGKNEPVDVAAFPIECVEAVIFDASAAAGTTKKEKK